MAKPPSGPGTTVGAYAKVTLPCDTQDWKKRQYYDESGNPTKTTTDEGYAYFATYASAGQEIEVGYFHNPNLRFNGYTLYVRHGSKHPKYDGFWNQRPSEAQPCGKTLLLQYLIGYDHNNASVAVVQVQSGSANERKGATYTFTATPGQATMEPVETPWGGGQPHPADGKGAVAVLSQSPWLGGCQQCTVGMLTAVAQNIPGGVPTDPLRDGAAFGPVPWKQVALDDHVDATAWTSSVTGSTRIWEKGITTATVTGGPPTYTVTNVQVPCVASTTGDDQWSC